MGGGYGPMGQNVHWQVGWRRGGVGSGGGVSSNDRVTSLSSSAFASCASCCSYGKVDIATTVNACTRKSIYKLLIYSDFILYVP